VSEPIRYGIADNQAQRTLGGNVLVVDPAGRLVEYADYARLKAEVERLETVIESHKDAGKRLLAMLDDECLRIKHLKAEVERLTKAGDAMADIIGFAMARTDGQDPKLVREWLAAKEGKQP
jgi:hypothetical protein